MKYLLFLFVLFVTTTAHSQCGEFDNLLKKGDQYLKGSKPNYQEAINAYTAAILACSDRAGEAKQRFAKMVNDINKLRESAVAAEKKASDALKQVKKEQAATEEQRQNAEQATKNAQAERDKAQTALTNLEKANIDVVNLILENADRDILNLRYEDALKKVKAAASLDALKPEVAKVYLEIAFLYGEIGNTERAHCIFDSTMLVVNKKIETAQSHRKAIEAFDSCTYTKLMERYYPVMVHVDGGTFDMGCAPGEKCGDLHKQKVSTFQMGKYETTWWQYYLFCRATGHKYESPGWGTEGDNPVVNVNWFDSALYLNWVNKQFGLDTFYIMENKRKGGYGDYYDVTLNPNAKRGYRLPTEAEWEYASKGGNRPDKTVYSGSNDLDLVGWDDENSGSRTRAVGKKQANALGLYDMSGNVWEWCWDWYDSYKTNPEMDYRGADRGSLRVFRGGSWYPVVFGAESYRTVFRFNSDPDDRSYDFGFRLVFVP